MTTLDQAFIKAFYKQGAKSAVVDASPKNATPAASCVAASGVIASVAPVAATSVSSSISSAFRGVLAALENPPAVTAKSDASVHAATPFADRQLKTAELLDAAAILRPRRLETFADAGIDLSGQLDAIAVATADLADASPASEVSPLPISQQSSAPLSSFLRRTTEEPAAETPVSTPAKPREFKPDQQVERFTWPKVCRRLISRSPDEFDRLADALLAAGTQGKRVLGIAGCRQGEGATTMLLCAARRLADRGVKLAMVDADLARPRLAKRLGVQPQLGWNETTVATDATGDSLQRAAIEAAANGLTLAPIQEPASPTAWTAAGWARLGAVLKTLRSYFEMTLVDLGPLENIEHVGDSLHRTIASELDAVLLIRNQRITSDEQLNVVEQELSAAGTVLAGLIENFIAE
jgi:Mrp family chromosome partitioning ATPase